MQTTKVLLWLTAGERVTRDALRPGNNFQRILPGIIAAISQSSESRDGGIVD
jgi:hypothetical protein